MASYLQAERAMTVTTPLGPDVLLLAGFKGYEAISQPFRFQLDLLAENSNRIDFDKIIGEKITINVELVQGSKRYFDGICSRISQGGRDEHFTIFRMEMVPHVWILGRTAGSRIFQHMSVPDILKKVLVGFDVAYDIQGTFEPRDYCVQYRESDFDFASRLMEEEGIFYFFKHTADGHKMVLANSPQSHAVLPFDNDLIFETVQGGSAASIASNPGRRPRHCVQAKLRYRTIASRCRGANWKQIRPFSTAFRPERSRTS
jgi:type VI secretion system secreted protein VgrG